MELVPSYGLSQSDVLDVTVLCMSDTRSRSAATKSTVTNLIDAGRMPDK
jgi:hypothetical protein